MNTINGNKVKGLKMTDFTPEQEKEFEFRRRYEEEQAAKQQEVGDKQINPLMPTVGGALAAEILGPSINKSSEAFMETKKLIKSGWDPKVASDFVRGKFGAVENWARQMHSGEFFGGRDMPEAYRQGMQTKYPGGIPANPVPGGPMPASTPVPTTPTPGAIPPNAAAAPKAAPTGMLSKITGSPTVQAIKAAGGAGTSGFVPAVIGRGVAGGATAYQGVDAYNRLQQGDIPGAIISGVGAIGSGASMIPHPVTRVGGTVIGAGAEALNAYLDYLKNKAQQPAPQATPQPAPQGMAQGGLVGGLDATYNMPLAGGASLSIGGPQQQQGQPMNPMMMPGGLTGIR